MSTLLRLLIVLVVLIPLSTAVAHADSRTPPADTDPPATLVPTEAAPPEPPPDEAAAPPAAPAGAMDPPAAAAPSAATPEPPPAPAAPAPGADPPAGAAPGDAAAMLAPQTIEAVVVRPWGGCSSASLIWDTLNTSWSSYGTVPIHINYNYAGLCSGTITYAALVASGADVLILSNPAGGGQLYSAAEIAAIKQYADAGHGLIGTYELLYNPLSSLDNRGLAPLFGVKSTVAFDFAAVTATYSHSLTQRLFRGLPNPYTSSGYAYTQQPADGTWDSVDLSGGTYLSRTTGNHAAIITYSTAAYRAVYITHMPEYGGGAQDQRFFYNAITYTGNWGGPSTLDAVVVRSWGSCFGNSLVWDSLNSNWANYGSQPVYIDYSYPGLCSGTITYAALAGSGADVLVLDDPAGGNEQYSAAEIAAIKQYAAAGHGLVGTFALLLNTASGTDNRGLAPLFGVNGSQAFDSASVAAAYNILRPTPRLFRGLLSPYTSTGYQYTQRPADGTWDAADLSGARYAAKSADNRAAIITYSTPAYAAVYITSMPEYGGGAQDERFIYNAINYTGNWAGPQEVYAVVLRSWDACSSRWLGWDTLNAAWPSYGSTPIYVDYNYPGLCSGTITPAALTASGADVLILSDPAGWSQQYSPAEVAAVGQYADAGHTLVGTYALLQNGGVDNRALAPLFGVKSSVSFNTAGAATVYNHLSPAHPLFWSLPNPYTSTGYAYTQRPADGTWDAADLSGARYTAKSADNRAAVITYRTPSYIAAYITSMPEYGGGAQDRQFLYNAITYGLSKIFLPLQVR